MNRWQVFRLGKTEVSIHPAVLIYLLYAAATGHVLFTVIGYLSISIHEAAHGMVSSLLGNQPSAIEITPLGAVMRLEDEEKLYVGKRLLVIISGPFMSLVLNRLSLFLPEPYQQAMFLSNLSILLINLIPVLPLDGGRILLLLLERIFPKGVAAKIIKYISMAFGTFLILLNILLSWYTGGWNLSLAFAGCCILYSASMSSVTHAMAEIRCFLDRKIMLERKGRVSTLWMSALHTMPINQLVRRLPSGHMMMFVCIEAGTGRVLGYIHESALIQQYLDQPAFTLKEALSGKKDGFV